MTLKIGSLYCWVSKNFYPIYEDFRKPIDPSRLSKPQYTLLNKNDIFLVLEYANVKGRDCYQILNKDKVGWIVDPASTSFIEISSNDKT